MTNFNQIYLAQTWKENSTAPEAVAILENFRTCSLAPGRFELLGHFGRGLAMVPLHGGFLACGGVKNENGKCCFWYSNGHGCHLLTTSSSAGFPGEIQMANDVNWQNLQSQIVMFQENTGQLLLGNFDREEHELTWRPLDGPNPAQDPPISKPCLVVDRGSLFIIGGINAKNEPVSGTWYLPNVGESRPGGNPWEFLPDFPKQKRSGAACFFHKHRPGLWVLGGSDTKSGSILTDSEIMSTAGTNLSEHLVEDGPKWSQDPVSLAAQIDDNTDAPSIVVMGVDEQRGLVMGEIDPKTNTYQQRKFSQSLETVTAVAGVLLPAYSLPECQISSFRVENFTGPLVHIYEGSNNGVKDSNWRSRGSAGVEHQTFGVLSCLAFAIGLYFEL